MSYESSPNRPQQLPPGTRLKGRWRQVLGIVIAVFGALAMAVSGGECNTRWMGLILGGGWGVG